LKEWLVNLAGADIYDCHDDVKATEEWREEISEEGPGE
jgi:hypothetical protein